MFSLILKDLISDFIFVFGENNYYPSNDFSLQRKTKDKEYYNNFCISLLQLCCTLGIHILNGRLFNDRQGNFACFANEGCSFVDCIIASSNLFHKIVNFGITDFDMSDHLPLFCSIKFSQTAVDIRTIINGSHLTEIHDWVKYKWNPEMKEHFLVVLETIFVFFQNNFLNDHISMVAILLEFIKVLQDLAVNMKVSVNVSPNIKRQPEWWDFECMQAKQTKTLLLRNFRQTNINTSLPSYLNSKRNFKNICKSKKLKLKRVNKRNLINSRNNPKQFWKNI